jgi:hypothetical protein
MSNTPVTVETIRSNVRSNWDSSMRWYASHMKSNLAESKANNRNYALQFLAQIDMVQEAEILDRDECGKMRDQVFAIYGAIIPY